MYCWLSQRILVTIILHFNSLNLIFLHVYFYIIIFLHQHYTLI